MAKREEDVAALSIAAIVIAVLLIFWGVVGYVGFHFIVKFW
jgi:hypothetical protein